MTKETSWKLYTNSEDAWDAMLLAIKEAKESVLLEQFILNYDSIGMKFLDALKERAEAGVKIKIFCDEVGSYSLYRSGIAASLLESNIEIKFFNSIVPWSPNNETMWFFRDHRKLLVIDNKVGFTGGVCLGDEMRGWRESSVMITGTVLQDMIESFYMMWDKTYHKFNFYIKSKSDKLESQKDFRYVINAPLPRKRFMYRELIRAIKNARHYIYLTTPYLLPDHKLVKVLKNARKRGVEIRILIPLTTNSKLVNIGGGTFLKDLLKSKIKIFRYGGSMIHAKTGVIDGLWSTIGSLNLDNLSLRYNFEGNLVSTNKEFAFALEKEFLHDLEKATELTLEVWNKRGLWRKFLEICIWPFRKLL